MKLAYDLQTFIVFTSPNCFSFGMAPNAVQKKKCNTLNFLKYYMQERRQIICRVNMYCYFI